jgi:drug/metabolite transporter (DMT)-like permease
MQNALLYLVTVVIWGSTWLAIKFQLGVVSPELSIAYRFALAAVLLFIYCFVRRLPMRFNLRQHGQIGLQAFFLFSMNYLVVYLAELYLSSGLVSIIFSLLIVFNVLFGALFLRNPIRPRVIVGGIFGIAGLVLVFWSEFVEIGTDSDLMLGIGLALLGGVSASLGNITSAHNQRIGLPVIQTNAIGMAYGAGIMFVIALFRGADFTIDPSAAYIISLFYLSLFGSVIAFGTYLTLLGRIGPDRAAYVSILFPIVALALSTMFEGLSLNALQLLGIIFILLGNAIVLTKSRVWRSIFILDKTSANKKVTH